MTYHIAICDDSAADRDYLAELSRRWAEERGHRLDLRAFASADGVALAKRLRREDETVQIIFVTGYSDYIEEGYEVAAVHYLMKPARPEKLFAVLDRAADRLKKAERVLTLDLGGETVRVPLYQVRYVDVRLNYATIHAKRDYTVKKPLGEIAAALDERFYRVGRSAVVNLTLIRRVTKTDIYLTDGSVIPLPRGAYEGVNRAIIALH